MEKFWPAAFSGRLFSVDGPLTRTFFSLTWPPREKKAALDLLYYLGLLMLMFLSGAETKALFQKHERKQIGWLAAVGTALPFFIMLALGSVLPLGWFMGVKSSRASLLLVMSIAVAVTSIPVISRIFFDLKILHTRFARLVLGVAVLEDIVLWAVLAIATAIADSSGLPARKIACTSALRWFTSSLVWFCFRGPLSAFRNQGSTCWPSTHR